MDSQRSANTFRSSATFLVTLAPIMTVISGRTVGVHAHLARRDVGGDTEIRQPQVLDLLVLKHVLDAMVKSATCQSTHVHS